MAVNLALRKNQVDKEDIGPVSERNYSPSRMVIHDHAADRAGEHLDIRFDIGSKAVSFATRKGLPTQVGKPVQLFRQPDHRVSYMDWEGDIPKGEYGAGSVKRKTDTPIVLKSSNDKIVFTVPDGNYAGTYAILKQDDRRWLAVKKKELERHWEPRPKYKEADLPPLEDEEKYLATEKIDGAHFIAKFNDNGVSFTSQRKSKSGDLIAREDNVPHLRDMKVTGPYSGMVVRGELWHDKGFNYVSGILNSKPDKAVERQMTDGLVKFAPFRIVKGLNGEENLPYSKQYEILKSMADSLPHFVDVPKMADKSIRDFHNEIGVRKGEGIVWVNKETGENFKTKHRFDYDLRIIGFTPGLGKYQGKAIGAIELADRTGNHVGNVGTGLEDKIRIDMYNNPDKYKGKLVKVVSRKPLIGKLREPSFLGFTTDKDEADEVK